MRMASSRPGEHGELMAQEQVLEHQILPWTHHGAYGCEQEPQNVKHRVSIADLRPRGVLPPYTHFRESPTPPLLADYFTRR